MNMHYDIPQDLTDVCFEITVQAPCTIWRLQTLYRLVRLCSEGSRYRGTRQTPPKPAAPPGTPDLLETSPFLCSGAQPVIRPQPLGFDHTATIGNLFPLLQGYDSALSQPNLSSSKRLRRLPHSQPALTTDPSDISHCSIRIVRRCATRPLRLTVLPLWLPHPPQSSAILLFTYLTR